MIHDWRGADALARLASLGDFHAMVGAPTGQAYPAAAVWSHYHASWTPQLIEVRDGSETVAAMGLAMRRWRGMLQVRTLGADDEETVVTAVDPTAAAVLGRAVCSRLSEENRRWTLRLGLLVLDPRSEAFVRTLPRTTVNHADELPLAVFEPDVRLSHYVSRKMRDGAHRARNLADRAGTPLVPRWRTDPASIAEVLPEALEVHRARNRQARGFAILDDTGEASHFRDQIMSHAWTGASQLLEVRAAGELAAFSVCLTNGSIMRVYANLVSPRWLHVNAGTFASVEVVRRAHADPAITVLSWGSGVSRYKLSCATSTEEVQSVQSYSTGMARWQWRASRPRWRRNGGGDSDTSVDPLIAAPAATGSDPLTDHPVHR